MSSLCRDQSAAGPIMVRNITTVLTGVNHKLTGVPRILEGTMPPHLRSESVNDPNWQAYEEYMSTTRININVRQVFPRGFSPGIVECP